MLALASCKARAFRSAHLPYLQSLALQVAHTVANIERYQNCQAQTGRLTTIVREVHHRVKNNLQGVIGLLGGYRDEHRTLAPVLNHAISHLHAVAEVHNLLSRNTREVIHLPELVGGICMAIGKFCAHRLESDLGPSTQNIIVSASEAVPIALVLNELIQNAIDHGYPDGRRGIIRVVLDASSGTIVLRIDNDGIPPPAAAGDMGAPFGMGLDLVRTLLPERGATFRLFHEGDWTVAEVVFAGDCPIFLKEEIA
jgi:two-component sensor histidine kinase